MYEIPSEEKEQTLRARKQWLKSTFDTRDHFLRTLQHLCGLPTYYALPLLRDLVPLMQHMIFLDYVPITKELDIFTQIPRDEITLERIEKEIREANAVKHAFGLVGEVLLGSWKNEDYLNNASSKVPRHNGLAVYRAYIPMFDLSASNTDEKLRPLVFQVCKTLSAILEITSLLIDSGNSYHFLGLDVLSQKAGVIDAIETAKSLEKQAGVKIFDERNFMHILEPRLPWKPLEEKYPTKNDVVRLDTYGATLALSPRIQKNLDYPRISHIINPSVLLGQM